MTVAEHLGCPLLRANMASMWAAWSGHENQAQSFETTVSEFLKGAAEWGALALFDGAFSVSLVEVYRF